MSATAVKYSGAGGRITAKYIQYSCACMRVCAHLRLCACNSAHRDECASMFVFVTMSAMCVTHQ